MATPIFIGRGMNFNIAVIIPLRIKSRLAITMATQRTERCEAVAGVEERRCNNSWILVESMILLAVIDFVKESIIHIMSAEVGSVYPLCRSDSE